MGYKIIISDDAEKDLFNISDYIERVSFSEIMAKKIIAEILSWIYALNLFPYMYPKIYKEYYSLSIRNRRIFYEVNEVKKEVVIYMIL